MADAKPFFGGLPTEIDVKKLVERFGVPTRGAFISYEEIATVLSMPYKTSRFRTVTDAWRRKLKRDHNLRTEADAGRGLQILTGPQRTEANNGGFKKSTRQLRRVAVDLAMTPEDDLDDDQRERKGHLQAVTARLFMAQANEHKSLKPPSAPSSLPRRIASSKSSK